LEADKSDMVEANRQAETAPAYHGGGLTAARRRFPEAPEPWLDLSTGINGLPYPVGDLSAAAFCRLPEACAIGALEAAAARAFGLSESAAIVAAPGTQSLIQLFPRLCSARTVAVLDFTYSEHETVWAAGGAEVKTVSKLEELARADVAVVVNPNNPDGRLVDAPSLLSLGQEMGERGKTLIVDEAFIDFLPPEASLAPLLPEPGLIVLRSFGKTYGLAGVRLGFALCDRNLAAALRTHLGPWAVSGAAVEIGQKAYADAPWRAQSAARLAEFCARLDAVLRGAGCDILGGTPLFRLARHVRAREIFERLGAAGVLTRPFAARPEWLRFGIPQDERDFQRLEEILLTPRLRADRTP
jgi:cobalamin biosynthetic protein CobC